MLAQERAPLVRARMSDATARQTFVEWHAPCPQCALDEARAILRETEPIRPGYSFADRIYRGSFLMVEPFDAERSLADSLAALCDTPDVAAYLAEMQTR